MCGDVLSCATAESGVGFADGLCAAVPTAIRVGRLAVKPDGTSTNRIVDEANAARERIARNSQAGHRESFPKYRLGADPRSPPGRSARQRPAPPPAARGPAGDTDSSVGGGTRGHSPSFARSDWHANAASGPLHPDTPGRNTATAHVRAQRTARSLSANSGAAAAPDWSLALKKIADHHEVDPRERQLPKGQVPERTSIPLRDALFPLPYPSASLRSRLLTRLPGRHFPPVGRRQPPQTTAGQTLP